MDIAWIGPQAAPCLVVISSGTHGVEGLCGSGIQAWLLESGLPTLFPGDTAIVLVHACNPYGFAHLRRVTEENVDLNRNFIDHAAPPASAAYAEIQGFLVPDDWEGESRVQADLRLAEYKAARGAAAWQAAVTAGQYTHADGLFYGGRTAAWSNRVWRSFLTHFCASRRHIVHIDLHTGLGPYGYGEKIVLDRATSPAYQRAQQLFGDDCRSPWAGDSASAAISGFLARAFADMGGEVLCTPLALEFGTVPFDDMIAALRADNWIHARGEPASKLGASIRHLMRSAFFIEEPDWQGMAIQRTKETVVRLAQALVDV